MGHDPGGDALSPGLIKVIPLHMSRVELWSLFIYCPVDVMLFYDYVWLSGVSDIAKFLLSDTALSIVGFMTKLFLHV